MVPPLIKISVSEFGISACGIVSKFSLLYASQWWKSTRTTGRTNIYIMCGFFLSSKVFQRSQELFQYFRFQMNFSESRRAYYS